jgi:hypothetical protein
MNSTTAAKVWRCSDRSPKAPLNINNKAGRRRLPPAAMMYWATSLTKGTSERKRSAMTASTRNRSSWMRLRGLVEGAAVVKISQSQGFFALL